MPGIVGIRFANSGRTFRYDSNGLDLQVGDQVVVDSEQGQEMGVVALARRPLIPAEENTQFRKVIRPATEADLAQYEKNQEDEKEAFRVCRDLIDSHQLDMMLVAAEYTLGERKLLFYFTAEGRVDFRDLVRDLAAEFKVRIELRQIGVRDDARKNGGMGICGRELCCSQWMENFVPVSIRMAKDQNISMNPTKVSGNCGRLLCCLNYENDAYKANRKLLPKMGAIIDVPGGKAKVLQQDILRLQLTLLPQNPDGSWGEVYTIPAEEIGFGEVRRKKEDDDSHSLPTLETLTSEEPDSKPAGQENPKQKEENLEDSQTELLPDTTAESCGGSCHCPKKNPDLRDNTLVASADALEDKEQVFTAENMDRSKQKADQNLATPPKRRSGFQNGRRARRPQKQKSSDGTGQAKPRYIIHPDQKE